MDFKISIQPPRPSSRSTAFSQSGYGFLSSSFLAGIVIVSRPIQYGYEEKKSMNDEINI